MQGILFDLTTQTVHSLSHTIDLQGEKTAMYDVWDHGRVLYNCNFYAICPRLLKYNTS